jgi:hypothetical protein
VFGFRGRKIKRLVAETCDRGVESGFDLQGLIDDAKAAGLQDKDIEEIRRRVAKQLCRPVMEEVDAALRFSPQQEQRINAICSALRLDPDLGEGLSFARVLWQLENDPRFLPESIAGPGLALARNELVYGASSAEWLRMKTVRERLGYSGLSVGVRVAKGITLRAGSYQPITRISEELARESTGALYITNKKILFVGDRKSTNVTYGRLARIEAFKDGFAVYKTSGPVDYFAGIDSAVVEYCDLLVQRFVTL